MKKRLDQLLVERGLAPSRVKARALILAGQVHSESERLSKAGQQVDSELFLEVRERDKFVSRGGLKLDGALQSLQVPVAGRTVVDIGASTGGFTDCVLQHGARRVYAVDVAKGMLAQRLRNDERVIILENTNARYLTRASFKDAIDLIVVDASFIGIDKLIGAIRDILPGGGELLALIKPQFEVGREVARRFRGVIKDAEYRERAIQAAIATIEAAGFSVLGTCDSEIRGPKGNLEHFVWARG